MTINEGSSGEGASIPMLSIEHNAYVWFRIDPEDEAFDDKLGEQRSHLSAIEELPPEHREIEDISNRIRNGTDPTMSHKMVRTVLKQAYDYHKLAVDELTGLKTQRELDRWLLSTFGGDKRTPKARPTTFIYGDVYNFKRINDLLGESIGDKVLEAVGSEVAGSLREGDHVVAARPHTAGDEVVIAATDLTEEESRGFWLRLYNGQWAKVESQQHMWPAIEQALALRAFDEKEATVNTELEHVDDTSAPIVHRILHVNGVPIGELRDLAMIDFGYSTGVASSVEEARIIAARAKVEKDRVKWSTHRKMGSYRQSGIPEQ